MSEAQIVFCERHGIPYDPSWSRGTINNTIDRYVVEVSGISVNIVNNHNLTMIVTTAPVYIPSWSRGTNNNTIDRYVLEVGFRMLLSGAWTIPVACPASTCAVISRGLKLSSLTQHMPCVIFCADNAAASNRAADVYR
jgi:hypothetical protein